MTEFIQNIFANIFGDNVILATILIAMIPIIELKGAIPFSMATSIWGSSALSLWQGFLFALLGTSIIIPILALIYKPLIEFLKRTRLFKNIGNWLDKRVNRKKGAIENKYQIEDESLLENEKTESNFNSEKADEKVKKNSNFKKIVGVFLFVAIPLPFTGVWTGTCIAIALNLGFWKTTAVVFVGNIVAALLTTFVSSLFGDSTILLVYILVGIILVFTLYKVISHLIKRKKNNE